jgi:hypothetical protein
MCALQLRCLRLKNCGTRFAVHAVMRRHHETTSAIVSALVMVIPVAGGLWARFVALQKAASPIPPEANHEQQP